MSKRLLTIFLSELTTVRLVCQRPSCRGVTEVAVEKVAQMYSRPDNKNDTPVCPICNATFTGVGSGPNNQLVRLADAVVNLRGVADCLEIEFVVPEPGETDDGGDEGKEKGKGK